MGGVGDLSSDQGMQLQSLRISTSDRLVQPHFNQGLFFNNRTKKKVATYVTLSKLRFSIHQNLLNVSQYLDRDPTWFTCNFYAANESEVLSLLLLGSPNAINSTYLLFV